MTLFVVLALAGTPAATTLCIGNCGVETPSIGTAATCHHRTTREGMPGILASGHECNTLLQAEPFVREDVQRIASGSVSGHAVVVIPGRLAASTPPLAEASAEWTQLATPRVPELIVLRI